MFSKKKLFFFLLFALIGFTTRFIKLDWGDGFFFHPDENNMAAAVSGFSLRSLDPHFYAYGQFPLYLTYFTGIIFNLLTAKNSWQAIPFETAAIILRIYSALFSTLSLYFVYRLGKLLFQNRSWPSLAFVLMVMFSPGFIQLAHYGTTESLLVLVFLIITYSACNYITDNHVKWLLLAGVALGVGLATKASGLIFALPVLLALFYYFIKSPSFAIVRQIILFFVPAGALAIILSPYNFINLSDFLGSLKYETDVATGTLRVFYTHQFLDSIPYVFQLTKIFPFSSGIIQYILSVAGLIVLIFTLPKLIKANNIASVYWSIILVPAIVYFLYFGQLYTKWFRFMSPIFYIVPLLATLIVNHIRHQYLRLVILFFSIIPGIFFIRLYFNKDIRHQFSGWFENNIPSQSRILSEAGNVINLPLTQALYDINNFNFYNLDSDPSLLLQLAQAINYADYILIPSRRIFANQNNSYFPISQAYYNSLFIGQLGFAPVAEFSPDNNFILSHENAEETFTVFDHPTIRLYKKVKQLELNDIVTLLQP